MLPVIFWFSLSAILFIVELLTVGLVCIWWAIGAIVAGIVAMLDVSIPVQIIVQNIVSILLFLSVRPIVKERMMKHTEKTNVDSIAGKIGDVEEEISSATGQGRVMLEGMDWLAKASDNSTIPVGAQVVVERVEGVKLIVKEVRK